MNKIRWNIAQFFEQKWWQNYLKNKDTQRYLTWKKSYWNTFLNEINIDKEQLQEPILDIGCGPAGLFIILSQEKVYALDPLLHKYEQLSVFNKDNYPNSQFINTSFEQFEHEKQFKTVFCLNAINHFNDIKQSFEKLAKITQTDGKLILSVDAHNHTFFRNLFTIFPLDILHPHQYYLKEYEQFLTQNGFEITQRKLKKKDFFFSYWVLVANRL